MDPFCTPAPTFRFCIKYCLFWVRTKPTIPVMIQWRSQNVRSLIAWWWWLNNCGCQPAATAEKDRKIIDLLWRRVPGVLFADSFVLDIIIRSKVKEISIVSYSFDIQCKSRRPTKLVLPNPISNPSNENINWALVSSRGQYDIRGFVDSSSDDIASSVAGTFHLTHE